ncbi:MAG TPA: DUF5677 domain-containing protein [Terracidiphilus sp.]|nr:DUF5677 domain-containing protein [Terracidiphilus sp.]
MNSSDDAAHSSGEASAKHTNVVFGFEEFWPKTYAQYGKQLDAIGDLIRIGDELVRAAEENADEPVKRVIWVLTSATMSGACEAVLLCGNGCGAGAMKVVRGMYESRWTAEYLRRNPSEVDDFLEFSKVLAWRRLHWRQGYNGRVAADVMKRAEDEFNRVKGRFPDGRGGIRHTWSKKSIRAIAKEVGHEKEYEAPYAVACSIHHANFEGISALFNSGNGALAPPPSEAMVKMALNLAHANLWFALATLNDSCGLGFDQRIDDAQRALEGVWRN